jgi:hypothetical protein
MPALPHEMPALLPPRAVAGVATQAKIKRAVSDRTFRIIVEVHLNKYTVECEV